MTEVYVRDITKHLTFSKENFDILVDHIIKINGEKINLLKELNEHKDKIIELYYRINSDAIVPMQVVKGGDHE